MPDEPPQKSDLQIPLAAIFLAGAIYILVQAFPLLSPILLSVLLVILFSLALNPVVRTMRGWIGGRTVATMAVLTIFLVIAGLTGWAFYSPVKKSATRLIERLPEYWERIQKPILKWEQKAAVSEQRVKEQVTTEVRQEEATNAPAAMPPPETSAQSKQDGGFLRSGLAQLLGGVTQGFKTIATNAAEFIMIGITVFVGVIFTLLNPQPVVALLFSIVPKKKHDKALRITQQIAEVIPRWALATILGMSIIGLLVFLAMWPILGFQDAVVLGLIAFVLEAVPYVGPLMAVLPALLLALGKGGAAPLWVLGAYALIQLIENNLIAPVIVAGRLKLHPVPVIFAILLSATVFGVLGVILAVPLVAVFGILLDELYRPRFLPGVSDEELDKLAHDALNPQAPKPRRKAFRFRRKVPVHSSNGH